MVKVIQFICPIEEEVLVATYIIMSERGWVIAPIELVQCRDACRNLVANLEPVEV